MGLSWVSSNTFFRHHSISHWWIEILPAEPLNFAWIKSSLWSHRSPNFWTNQSCFLSSNWFQECKHLFIAGDMRSMLFSQHSFWLPLRMNGMHRAQFDCARLDLLSLVIWAHVLTIYHLKPTQSTTMEQKRFDLRSLSPALRNLWLLQY